jgi:hypothetical protein
MVLKEGKRAKRVRFGQNETEQPDHSASLGDSITSSTQIRFSVHTVVIAGSTRDFLKTLSWAKVPSSSLPIKRLYPATSAARIAAQAAVLSDCRSRTGP